MKLGIFLLKIIIVITIIMITTIVITPVRPHKHDQAGGHGPALFWPLKLRRFRVHILEVYYTTYQHTSSILYYLPTALVLEYIFGILVLFIVDSFRVHFM